MVDSPESKHLIFPFYIDYTRVQSKIAMKYDYWQREVLQKFGNALGMIEQFIYQFYQRIKAKKFRNLDAKILR